MRTGFEYLHSIAMGVPFFSLYKSRIKLISVQSIQHQKFWKHQLGIRKRIQNRNKMWKHPSSFLYSPYILYIMSFIKRQQPPPLKKRKRRHCIFRSSILHSQSFHFGLIYQKHWLYLLLSELRHLGKSQEKNNKERKNRDIRNKLLRSDFTSDRGGILRYRRVSNWEIWRQKNGIPFKESKGRYKKTAFTTEYLNYHLQQHPRKG